MSAAATSTDETLPAGRFGFVIGLLRQVIQFGKELAAAIQQPGSSTTTCFGADGLAVILARIARGLLRAQVLQDRLLRYAARPERKPRSSPATPSQRAARTPPPRLAAVAPDPTRPPTAESIAAEDCRRPIGAVLVDICHDLGIMPCHPLWRDITRALGLHRGSIVTLFNSAMDRMFEGPRWQAAMRTMFPQQPAPLAAATGPP